MMLREILAQRRAAVCEDWLGAVLDEYGEVTAARWRREQDPFANPVGHAFRTALPRLLEAVLGEGEPGADAQAALEEIVRVRSVQDLAPSRAVGFVFRLRRVIRDGLAAELAHADHAAELEALDGRVERLALLAFDAFVRCRERIFRLRQEELKRSVGSLLRRWHGAEASVPDQVVRLSPPKPDTVR